MARKKKAVESKKEPTVLSRLVAPHKVDEKVAAGWVKGKVARSGSVYMTKSV